jgi:hypothetical protein
MKMDGYQKKGDAGGASRKRMKRMADARRIFGRS